MISRLEWEVSSINSKSVVFHSDLLELKFVFDDHDFLTKFNIHDLSGYSNYEVGFIYFAYVIGADSHLPPIHDNGTDEELFASQILWFIDQLKEFAPDLLNGDFEIFDSRTKALQIQEDSKRLYTHVINLPHTHPSYKKFINHDYSWIDDVKSGMKT